MDVTNWTDADWKREEERRNEIKGKPFTDETKCTFVGGSLDGKVMTVKELKESGLVVGKLRDWSERRARGGLCHARVLDNAPVVKGYVGPMVGWSDCPFRYETSAVYEQLSR